MLKTFLLFLVCLLPVAAQPFGAGLKIGAPFTDAVTVRNVVTAQPLTADTKNLIVGPYVELRLPFRLAVELDALYRAYDFNIGAIRASTNTWEFPLVLKHRLLSGPIRPYFEGGFAFSRLSDIPNVSINHLSSYGGVVGGGVELNLAVFKIAPELRYTGWSFKHFDNIVESNRNQFMFLLNVGF
jgi:hypothetical protein